jgi:hypothetical protein
MPYTVYVNASTLPLATVGPGGLYEGCDWRGWLGGDECVYVAAEVEMPAGENEPDDILLDAVRFYKKNRAPGGVLRFPASGAPQLVITLPLLFKPGVVGVAKVLVLPSAEE